MNYNCGRDGKGKIPFRSFPFGHVRPRHAHPLEVELGEEEEAAQRRRRLQEDLGWLDFGLRRRPRPRAAQQPQLLGVLDEDELAEPGGRGLLREFVVFAAVAAFRGGGVGGVQEAAGDDGGGDPCVVQERVLLPGRRCVARHVLGGARHQREAECGEEGGGYPHSQLENDWGKP